jgi:hypothetical protein
MERCMHRSIRSIDRYDRGKRGNACAVRGQSCAVEAACINRHLRRVCHYMATNLLTIITVRMTNHPPTTTNHHHHHQPSQPPGQEEAEGRERLCGALQAPHQRHGGRRALRQVHGAAGACVCAFAAWLRARPLVWCRVVLGWCRECECGVESEYVYMYIYMCVCVCVCSCVCVCVCT